MTRNCTGLYLMEDLDLNFIYDLTNTVNYIINIISKLCKIVTACITRCVIGPLTKIMMIRRLKAFGQIGSSI